ncbi:putative pyrophosphatase/phosphodiesterase [Smittium mucronatum]|uniref:Putative pyrophosphatase/phosphodiesterase n=1 Tax=Smittium mucronatum TaxID=133383 RepID=A0A1R0H009_9FUNG|nr:putative pyrophosphatase/phosphodiesterase [Smittium mucronatum]
MSKASRFSLKTIASSLFFSAFAVSSPLATRADNSPLNDKRNTVIVISIDGFAQDYFSLGLTPNIANLGKSGVFPEYMSPVFPSVTFPNHYTIATGLYPEHHGIVGNTFYSKALNDTFYYTQPSGLNSKWWGGEPIWVTAVKNNIVAGVNMFPGSESEIMGIRPTYYSAYNGSVTQISKMDGLVDWLELPSAQRPALLMTYFPEVDSAGHSFGPYSKGVNDSLVKVDSSIKYLVDKLVSKNLFDKVNIIIVSDHGMSLSLVPGNYISLNSLLAQANLELSQNSKKAKCLALKPVKEKILAVHLSPHAGIYPVSDSDIMPIYKKLKMVEDKTRFSVYLKKDIPKRFVYDSNERIPPILVEVKEPYVIRYNATEYNSSDLSKRSYDLEKRQAATNTPSGVHGYDNMEKNMRAIFVAHGPAFNSPKVPTNSTNFPPISAVDVYDVVAKLLKVTPAKNDGNPAVAAGMVL